MVGVSVMVKVWLGLGFGTGGDVRDVDFRGGANVPGNVKGANVLQMPGYCTESLRTKGFNPATQHITNLKEISR